MNQPHDATERGGVLDNATTLFGQTFDCECGRRHHIEPRTVVYAPDAVDRLPHLVAQAEMGKRALVLMDARTAKVGGRAAAAALEAAGHPGQRITVPDPAEGESPVCDDVTEAWIASEANEPEFIVSVGSGVISDLGKWLAGDRELPFVVVGTAASMNGYASANVAPTLNGLKSLVRARPPAAVLADPRVIAGAPSEMTASGLGDILAKSVSSTDWRLNHILFGDYYCPRAVGLIEEIEPLYLERPAALRERNPEAIEALFTGLLLTGVAMTMAETSAPSSGGEHMVSHALDMLASAEDCGHDLHGRQVGIGTILASELYRRVLAVESPDLRQADVEINRRLWGPLAGVVAEAYAEKRPRIEQAADVLRRKDAWDSLREKLSAMIRPPERIRDCLKGAGAAHRAEDIGIGRERLLTVFGHAHEIRSRFTILDLARLAGVMPDAAQEIVEAWG